MIGLPIKKFLNKILSIPFHKIYCTFKLLLLKSKYLIVVNLQLGYIPIQRGRLHSEVHGTHALLLKLVPQPTHLCLHGQPLPPAHTLGVLLSLRRVSLPISPRSLPQQLSQQPPPTTPQQEQTADDHGRQLTELVAHKHQFDRHRQQQSSWPEQVDRCHCASICLSFWASRCFSKNRVSLKLNQFILMLIFNVPKLQKLIFFSSPTAISQPHSFSINKTVYLLCCIYNFI